MPTENRSNDAYGWIACDDGQHLIQMDKNLSHYGWVFRKVDGGLPYSVREATPHEMAHAQARQHLRIGVAQIAGQAPSPQPHPEPIAWMVGTAFWWTKEEAERDAAATGLPMIPIGPMVDTADVERLRSMFDQTNADLREVTGERDTLRNCLRTEVEAGDSWKKEAQELRAQLADRDSTLRELLADDIPLRVAAKIEAALSASAEPIQQKFNRDDPNG